MLLRASPSHLHHHSLTPGASCVMAADSAKVKKAPCVSGKQYHNQTCFNCPIPTHKSGWHTGTNACMQTYSSWFIYTKPMTSKQTVGQLEHTQVGVHTNSNSKDLAIHCSIFVDYRQNPTSTVGLY